MSGRAISNPSAERNKEPILSMLRSVLPSTPTAALEVASGTGTHVAHFAANLPQVTWQPTDLDPANMQSITAYSDGLPTILPALVLDASKPPPAILQGGPAYDLVLCINMIHISPWEATMGLFTMAGQVLRPGGILVTYGPYAVDGVLSPESNQQFNMSLKSRNPSWGIRDVRDIRELASGQGLELQQVEDMPANNKTLVFLKKSLTT